MSAYSVLYGSVKETVVRLSGECHTPNQTLNFGEHRDHILLRVHTVPDVAHDLCFKHGPQRFSHWQINSATER